MDRNLKITLLALFTSLSVMMILDLVLTEEQYYLFGILPFTVVILGLTTYQIWWWFT